MPPLRERGEDIVLLFKKFAMEIAVKYQMPERITLSPDAEEIIKRYKWPGNIRQLKNVTEQMSILMRDTRVVTPDILSEYEIWPTIEEQGGLVRVGHHDTHHDYQSEREMLFQMINALHREVNDLKQEMAHLTSQQPIRPNSVVPVTTPASTVQVSPATPSVVPVVATAKPTINIQAPHTDSTPYAEEYVEESLSIEEQEKKLIEKNKGRRKRTADELHISERTLYRKIKEYGLDES